MLKSFIKCKIISILYCKNINTFLRQHNIKRRSYCGRKTKHFDSINNYLTNCLQSNRPFFYGRVGMTEGKAILEYMKKSYEENIVFSNEIKYDISIGPGVFSNDDMGVKKFCEYQIQAIKNLTGLKVWYIHGEEPIIKNYLNKNAILIGYDKEEISCPWSYYLKNKKVLVISSFCKSIKKQYSDNRTKIWEDKRTLPPFELKTVDSIVSLGGQKPREYKTWEEALLSMFHKRKNIDFDVCLIGAGGYSLPLGNLIYSQLNKQVIVLNSQIQILFGIYGERYLNASWFNRNLINKYWVRPLKSERPKNYKIVEGGCYW